MADPIDDGSRDTLPGLELQVIELVERQQRAETQGRAGEAAALQSQIDALHLRMAAAAEAVGPADTAGSSRT